MHRCLAGAVGGLVATVPMTVAMSLLFRKLPASEQYPLPPREITEEVVDRTVAPDKFRDTQLTYLSLAAHFAYGAATGAFYPLLVKSTRHPLISGGTYGLAVWAASYLGWLPAANILKPATKHPNRRNALMLFAHWIWGASTAVASRAIGPSPSSDRSTRDRPGD